MEETEGEGGREALASERGTEGERFITIERENRDEDEMSREDCE